MSNTPITKSEVKQFIHDWFHKLNKHPDLNEMHPFVTTELKISTPVKKDEPFNDWYDGAAKYRDQIHTVKALEIMETSPDTAMVKVIVRWERSDSESPSPGTRLASYAAQTWTLERWPEPPPGLRIVAYDVDYLLDEMQPLADIIGSTRDFSSHIYRSLVQPIIPERNRVHEAIANDQVVFAAFLSNANLRMVDAVIRTAEVDDGKGRKFPFGPAAAFIDYEHAPFTTREVEDLVIYLHAAGVVPFVRMRENNPYSFKPFLDMGALGLVIPQIGSEEDAVRAWEACLYSKKRPAGVGRASEYFVRFPEYQERADDLMSVVLMVERRDAVDNIEDICKVLQPRRERDMLHVGPYDLAQDMRTERDSVDHKDAIRRIEDAARRYGIRLAGHASTLSQARDMFDRGYRFLTYGEPYEVGLAKSGERFFTK